MDKPNVIWILGDQHRGQALGCNGDPNARTPNLDNLAENGVNFVNAVGGFPLCCPFRGSMLTSRYPHHCVPGHEYQLPPEQQTIADVFNENGYDTAYFGKWHLDGFHEREGRAAMHIVPPERRGSFKHWTGYENNNSQYDCWVHGGENKTAFHYLLPGYETDALTDLMIRYIKEHTDEAFFAVLSVQPPHNPYVAPPEYRHSYNAGSIQLRPNVPPIKSVEEKARRDLAGYYAMIENLDMNTGRIQKALEDAGIDRKTHIFFFSDHGDMHGSHGQYLKTSPYEESIRIPCILGGEGITYNGRKGGRSSIPINHVDFAPTTLGLCGIEKPDWMEGTDYSGCRLASRPMPKEIPDSAFIQSVIPTMHGNSIDRPWRGIVTLDGWKYVCMPGVPWMLFNLNEDPYEFMNIAHNTAHRVIRRKLNDRLARWVAETGDEFLLPEV